ncbi:MAG TPA: cell division protein ZipA C-terminal FtsZ-binding domain-containing protein [Steroidobacteraceae bacterium]|jgi:FtsZ-interacting cell division protein ZipA|nr:cell division protein ZipA C-terminal FtsZ-binding domain-containing protein [Steroidobacteraceae bacterium]
MSELRWILLAVGLVFLIGLTAWESRRARLARVAARERARALAETIPFEQPGASGVGPARGAGPALGELPAAAVADFPLDATESEEPAIRAEQRGALNVEELPSVPLEARHAALPGISAQAAAGESETAWPADSAAQSQADAQLSAEPQLQADEPVDAQARVSDDELPEAAAQGVSVEWPPEEQRRIVAVRIVSNGEQRLSGRATRQALAACGFVHGRYRIFHQPDAQGHALVSCASLNKPGVFDPSSMDYQRYSGLSLFTVLPGPLSTPDAVDRLLHTALDLSERLQARLQDDAGQTLDEARIVELRTRYRELDAMAGPPA